MKIVLILMFSVLFLAVICAVIIRQFSGYNEIGYSKKEVNMPAVLWLDWSMNNATDINSEFSAPNSPVRADGQEFFEVIVSELLKERDDKTLAKRLLNIRNTFS